MNGTGTVFGPTANFQNLPANSTVNITGNSTLTTSSGVIRLNNSNITVGSGSSLAGAFWDLNQGDIAFANGSIATMNDWEQKGTNAFTFTLGSSGFTALTPNIFRLGGGATMANATYNADMASYTGGIGIITLMDFTTDSTNMTSATFLTATRNVQNAGVGVTANLQWNDTTNAIELNVTAVPEPSTWALLAISLTTVMVLRRRRVA